MSDQIVSELVESDGIQPPTGFAPGVGELDAMRLFAKAIPAWSSRTGRSCSFQIFGNAEGVEINIGLSEGSTEADAQSLLDFLRDCERLDRMVLLTEEFRHAGVSSQITSRVVEDANVLALRLFPPDRQD